MLFIARIGTLPESILLDPDRIHAMFFGLYVEGPRVPNGYLERFGRRTLGSMISDPVATNSEFYQVVFENERVRVLEYTDNPGEKTTQHHHPDSVMITLSAFKRRISAGTNSVDVELPAGTARWLQAQDHSGENIGDTPTHTFFVELKESATAATGDSQPKLGPISS